MKRNKFLSLFLILVLLFSVFSPPVYAAPAGQTLPEAAPPAQTPAASAPTVQAKAALLLELNTDQVLFEQNADTRVYPASLTKIMTCMLTLEHGNLSDEVTVSATALEGLSEAGSTADLQAGETLTLEQLLYCMMLSSANEACNVAAEYVSGSVAAFVELMNQRAQALGCTDTHFANPHGLHDENHYTTARDLSLITREALKLETFKTITSAATHQVPATNLSGPRELKTTNFLISRDTTSEYYYEYATGVKTGFTTPAGRCLIAAADNGKLSLLSVVCGAETVVLDTGDLQLQNFTETKALLEYGFEHFAYAVALPALPIAEIPVLLSAGAEAAVLSPDKEIAALLPADYDAALIQTEIKLQNDAGVEAPITKGQALGTITVSYQGRALGTANLVAITDIARSQVAAVKANTGTFFSAHWWQLLIGLFALLIVLYIVIACVKRARRRRARQRKRDQARRRQDGDIIEFPGKGRS